MVLSVSSSGWRSGCQGVRLGFVVGVDAVQQLVEFGAGELPVERSGDGVVAGLERGQAVADLAEASEVVGVYDFALDDREVDFSLLHKDCPSSLGGG